MFATVRCHIHAAVIIEASPEELIRAENKTIDATLSDLALRRC